jgi:hypothetical protein
MGMCGRVGSMIGMNGRSTPPYELSFIESKLIIAIPIIIIIIVLWGFYSILSISNHNYVKERRFIVDKQIIEQTVPTSGLMPLGKIWLITNGIRRDTNHTLILDDGTKTVVKKDEYDLYNVGDPYILERVVK